MPPRQTAQMGVMEEQMGEFSHDNDTGSGIITPRRGFFGRVAAVAALGLSGIATASERAQAETSDGLDWPGPLKGRHKQVIDAYTVNGGFPLGFANNFLTPNASATAVVIFRHEALPLAIDSAIWEKYKIGETLKIIDPETKMPAVKNPYLRPKAGVLNNPEIAIDRLMARGTVFGCCAVALRGQSRRLAANAGVSPEEATREWTANVIAGITVIPSGTWGVNRAQEAGCTYCAGG